MRFICLIFLCITHYSHSQTLTFYTLANDSVALNCDQKKLVLVYHTNRSCFDCFISIHQYLSTDSTNHYFFIIEKTPSPIANYNIFTMLAAKGIPKNRLLFTNTQSGEISPFVKIYNAGHSTYIPYKNIFRDKEILRFSKQFKNAVKH